MGSIDDGRVRRTGSDFVAEADEGIFVFRIAPPIVIVWREDSWFGEAQGGVAGRRSGEGDILAWSWRRRESYTIEW